MHRKKANRGARSRREAGNAPTSGPASRPGLGAAEGHGLARTPCARLVLASTSPFRRALLQAAGLPFRAVDPQVREEACPGLTPKGLAQALALAKAQAVAARYPRELVLGCDQTLEIDGELLRKPRSRAEARRQLERLSGRTHRLHAALALCCAASGLRRVEVESVRLTMRPLAPREIEAYLRTDEWRGCAGGFRIEGQGLKLFEIVRGDFQAVIGLPLLRLVRMLREQGFELFRG